MRIAQVLHRMDWAGAEVLAAGLARHLRDVRGDAVAFICLDGVGGLGELLRGEGFVVECVGRGPGIDRGAMRRLREVLGRLRVDVIHAHQYTPFFYSAWARRGVPIVFTEHGRHVPDVVSRRRRLANRWLLGRGDAVTSVSRFVKDALVAHEGIAAARIEVIVNGIDLGQFVRDDAVRERVRRAWGVSEADAVVMQVARFHPVKDHATGLRAFAAASTEGPRSVWVTVGDGPTLEDTRRLAERLGVGDRVRFLGLRHDVPELWCGADVAMLSSVSEGLPVTVLEAMAAGLPVAATAVGGVPEAVEDGVTGLLATDEAGLSRQLARLIADAELRTTLGEAGRHRAITKFSQEQMHRAYVAVYDRIIGGRARPGPDPADSIEPN